MKDKQARELIGRIMDTLETYNELHDSHNESLGIIDDSINMLRNRIMDIEKRLLCTQQSEN